MPELKEEIFNKKRAISLIVGVSAVFVVFAGRLVDWQIINYEHYKKRARESTMFAVKTAAIRGDIVDANGAGIAVNDTGYRVVIDRAAVNKETQNQVILKTARVIEKLGDKWIDTLPIDIVENDFSFKDDQKTQASVLKKKLKLSDDSSARECMDKLSEKYECQEGYTDAQKRIICSIRYNMERTSGYGSRVTPYILADDVKRETMSVISEYSPMMEGLRVEASVVRKYPDGWFAPHIIGYTGSMSGEEYEKLKDTYSMDETIGKTGIEKAMESYLRGTAGKRMIQISRSGSVMKVAEKENAVPGNTVYLTLLSDVQRAANKSLKENIEKAREMGVDDCRAGAAVVLNVKDFSVIAAATYPGYDLERLMKDSKYYTELVSDAENKPLIDRALNGAFTPGSVYKPLVACTALETGVLQPDETVRCSGAFNYYKGYTLKCMGVHGNANLIYALAKSCNVFFAEMGRRIGAQTLGEYARKFGIGVKTGVEIYEGTGVVAGPEHSNAVGSKWYESGSAQAGIGQSDNMITPMQLAAYTATIANGGNRYRTHFIRKVMDYTKTKLIMENNPDHPEIIETQVVSPEYINLVKEGMRQVVLGGTALNFKTYPIEIAAKTGTAQNPGSDHTTFICFAPYENPEIAISVVIANGKHGILSKNVAKDILDAYFHIES